MDLVEQSNSIIPLVLESNLINFLVVLGLLFFLLVKYLPGLKKDKQNQILKELEEAKAARKLAEEKLKDLENMIEEAKIESKKIIEEANSSGEKLKQQIQEESRKQSESIKLSLDRELESSRAVSIEEIKRSVLNASLRLAEEKFKKDSDRLAPIEIFNREIVKELRFES
jgi:F-type H+-transporting ATPase subunit b